MRRRRDACCAGVHSPMCQRHIGREVGADVARPTLSRPQGVRPRLACISASAAGVRSQLKRVVVAHDAGKHDGADPMVILEGDETVFGYSIVDQELLINQ